MPLMKRGNAPALEQLTEQGIITTSTTMPVEVTKRIAAAKTGSDSMSKAEWASKDRRISRQGLFQAALNSVGLLQLNTGNTFEDYMKLVEQAAERGLQFVNRE